MGVNKNYFGEADSRFATLSGKGGRVTPKDVAKQKRRAQNHELAELSEKEARQAWLMCQAKNLELGFEYHWLDQQFEHRGAIYRVIGVRVTEDEILIMCRVVGDGPFFKTSVEFVRQKMVNR